MPRTKGSKNRPKTNNDYATQIAEKQEAIDVNALRGCHDLALSC